MQKVVAVRISGVDLVRGITPRERVGASVLGAVKVGGHENKRLGRHLRIIAYGAVSPLRGGLVCDFRR